MTGSAPRWPGSATRTATASPISRSAPRPPRPAVVPARVRSSSSRVSTTSPFATSRPRPRSRRSPEHGRATASVRRSQPRPTSTAMATSTWSPAPRGLRRSPEPPRSCTACRARTSTWRGAGTGIAPAGPGAQTGSAVAAGSSLDGGDVDTLVSAPGIRGAFVVGGSNPPPLAQPAPPPAATPAAGAPTAPGKAAAHKKKPKKLPLCPLTKPKPRYHTVKGKRVKVKPKPCRPLTARQRARAQGQGEGKSKGEGPDQGEGQDEGRGQVARPVRAAA